METLNAIYEVSLEAAPWLVLGLVVAGLIHAFLPPAKVTKWLGGHGLGSILKAALLGAPLPLCSCGVLPVAVGLRKAGASRGATASFMVSTPETGVDSVSITYALMGPVYAIARPVAAVVSAIVTGLLVEWFGPAPVRRPVESHPLEIAGAKPCCATEALHEPQSCCATKPEAGPESCCSASEAEAIDRGSMWARLFDGQRYAATRLIDDLAKWLFIGIVVAGLMRALIPTDALAEWGAGPLAYGVMLLIGLPLYVCATASTPIGASLLLAGVAPGPVLVFLLAGPATNIATLGVLKRELGAKSIAPYLIGVGGVALCAGLALDALASADLLMLAGAGMHAHSMAPEWLALACLIWLCFIALRPVRSAVFRAIGVERPSAIGESSMADCCGPEESVPKPATCCSHSP